MESLSDDQVIKRILEGEPEQFRVLVDRYKIPVAGIIRQMMGDHPSIEDIGQETFIKLYRSLQDFRGEASLKTYIIRIAMNLCLNEIKRDKRNLERTIRMDEGLLANYSDTSKTSERADIREMIMKAVNVLDPRQKSVFILRMIEGYSTKETAAILQIPAGTVLSRLSRAIEEVKKRIKM